MNPETNNKVTSYKEDEELVYQCVICGFEGYEQEMDAHVTSQHPDWLRAWNLARPGWLLEVHNKISGKVKPEEDKAGTLVIVDRDRLAKQIEAMCGAYRKGKDNLTNMCYEAIAYCEMMEKSNQDNMKQSKGIEAKPSFCACACITEEDYEACDCPCHDLVRSEGLVPMFKGKGGGHRPLPPTVKGNN